MTALDDGVRVLSRALDQTGDVLAQVRAGQLSEQTPCTDWTVGRLIDHLVADPANLARMMRGEQPDWSMAPDEVRENWAARFRSAADDLIHAWHRVGDASSAPGPDFHTAEFAIHTWDLATAIGRPTDDLDAEVAERALAFLQQNLAEDRRAPVFGPEQPAPPGANPYERLAAFAGRTP